MPSSFSRFLNEEDLAKVRQQYLAELEKTNAATEEPADGRGQGDGSTEESTA